MICGETLYRRAVDGVLLLCLDRDSADRVMREVHVGVCGPYMGGHMLGRKILRASYYWLTMETNCCQFVQICIVSDAWRSHTHSTIKVACIDLTLAIFSMRHRCYWQDFAEVF